jgi:trimeric autotransporter adhesin
MANLLYKPHLSLTCNKIYKNYILLPNHILQIIKKTLNHLLSQPKIGTSFTISKIMKKLLLLLFLSIAISTQGQYNFYYGNIHAHSSYSDGNKDSIASGYYYPGQDFYYAKGSFHMDFLGISEHNHYNASNNPGMHVADYARGMYQADTANADGSFTTMFGFEWGIISNGGHVVTYGVPGLVGWETGSGAWGSTNNYNIFCAKSVYTNFWPIVHSYPNAFCTLAHPQTGDYNNLLEPATTYSSIADDAIVGVATRSGGAFSTTTNYSDAAATSYDSAYIDALAKGYHVGPTIDHDNHYATFGRTNHGRTVVLANTLTRNDIMGAYRANRFYASDDWDAQVNFTVNGNVMGSNVNVSTNSSISLSITDAQNNVGAADPIKKIELLYGRHGSGLRATILTSNLNSNTLNFVHNTNINDSFYYFVKITELDNDIIWTAPIWIKNVGSTLPINLNEFSGKEINNDIQLFWSTAQEINTNYFEIEHSADGITFTTIKTVSSKYHNSNIKTDYTIVDNAPSNGINYYRIKEMSYDGKVSYTNIISINKNNNDFKLIVTPNPVAQLLSFNFYSKNEDDAVGKIYSSEGREIKSFKIHFNNGENKIDADVNMLTKGIYFLVLAKPNIRLAETSFVKE